MEESSSTQTWKDKPHAGTSTSWLRLLPPVALCVVIVYYNYFSSTMPENWPFMSPRKAPGNSRLSGLIPRSALVRDPLSRDKWLSKARDHLEYWWYINQQQLETEGQGSNPCPLATQNELPEAASEESEDHREFLEYALMGIDSLEAMGFGNITTCMGRYPRYSPDVPRVRSFSDKMQRILADAETSTEGGEDLVEKKFCYMPTYKPPTKDNLNFGAGIRGGAKDMNGRAKREVEELQLSSDPTFCQRLLRLYRDIVAGVEPRLLTMFVWMPEPIEDAAKVSRRFLALNLDLFKPFVQPVLVTNRRMVMAIGNSLNWPFVPVEELSDDGFPVLRPLSQAVMHTFNSTFYGYVRGASLFDASLLETLLAIKEKFSIKSGSLQNEVKPLFFSKRLNKFVNTDRVQKSPGIFMYGSAMHISGIPFGSDFSAVGTMAAKKGQTDWPDRRSSLTYFIHTKTDLSGLPPLKIEDKHLIPILSYRWRALGDIVIDTSNTILTLYNIHNRDTNEWNRMLVPTRPLNDSYNRVIAQNYIMSRNIKISRDKKSNLYKTRFGERGKILVESV